MGRVGDLPEGGQAREAWSKPERSKGERRVHVLGRLESGNKAWIATANADGGAHMVPFSFVWDGECVTMATREESPAARNVARTGEARLAVGDFGDVVLIDGSVDVVTPEDLADDTAERLHLVSAIDARSSPGFVYLRLTPWRVQAWWSVGEMSRPTVMRDGEWLT